MPNFPSAKSSLQAKVTFSVTESIYARLMATIPNLVFIAAMLVFKLQGHISNSWMAAWLGAFFIVSACQFGLIKWFDKNKTESNGEKFSSRLLVANAALMGTLWGFAALFFMPTDTIGQSYLMLIVGFVAAGGPFYLFGSFPAGFTYVTCALLPLTASIVSSTFGVQHHEVYFNVMLAVVSYWLLLTVMSYQGSKLFSEVFTLRFLAQSLESDLVRANDTIDELSVASSVKAEKNALSAPSFANLTHASFVADPITGLDTAAVMQIKFIIARAFAHRHHQSLAIVRLDITNFAELLDDSGTDIANLLMKTVAVRLQYCRRETDILAKIDQDKVVLIISEVVLGSEIHVVVNRILKMLAEQTVLNDQKIEITPCIGISVYPKDGTELSELILHAETALTHVNVNHSVDPVQLYDAETMQVTAHSLHN